DGMIHVDEPAPTLPNSRITECLRDDRVLFDNPVAIEERFTHWCEGNHLDSMDILGAGAEEGGVVDLAPPEDADYFVGGKRVVGNQISGLDLPILVRGPNLGSQENPTDVGDIRVAGRKSEQRDAVPSVHGFRTRLLVARVSEGKEPGRPRMSFKPIHHAE